MASFLLWKQRKKLRVVVWRGTVRISVLSDLALVSSIRKKKWFHKSDDLEKIKQKQTHQKSSQFYIFSSTDIYFTFYRLT